MPRIITKSHGGGDLLFGRFEGRVGWIVEGVAGNGEMVPRRSESFFCNDLNWFEEPFREQGGMDR
jgi:hypothetical protein